MSSLNCSASIHCKQALKEYLAARATWPVEAPVSTGPALVRRILAESRPLWIGLLHDDLAFSRTTWCSARRPGVWQGGRWTALLTGSTDTRRLGEEALECQLLAAHRLHRVFSGGAAPRHLCAARHGQEVEMATLVREVGISQPTAKAWLGVLEAAYLILLSRRPSISRSSAPRENLR